VTKKNLVLLLSICIGVVLLCSTWWGYFYFEYQKHSAQKTFKALTKKEIAAKEKVYFVLEEIQHSKEIKWIHSKEFRYKGKMYDILSKFKKNKSTILICIHDFKESIAYANKDKWILMQVEKSKNPNTNSAYISLHWFLQGLFLELNNMDIQNTESSLLVSQTINLVELTNYTYPPFRPPIV
jgi:hypothetical protein